VFLILLVRERSYVVQQTQEPSVELLPKSDCGVVLTGSPGRVREAFEVLVLKKIDKLIVSGVYKDAQLHEIFPYLNEFPDIRSENIILEKISGSTYQNAIQSLVLVQALKCKNILLMTSQLHMYRAHKTFQDHFPEDLPIHTYSILNPTKENSEWAVFVETFKSLFYLLAPLIQ
jgi:uncharacterized SAM-binding protein YcdF (DUF218 family)